MNNFEYARASVADAVRRIAADPSAKFIAGGTNLIDLMKENVARPSRLIDITHLPLRTVEETRTAACGSARSFPSSDLAYHPKIEARYPLLASAILAGPHSSCATWPRPGAIFCNGPAAPISTTRPRRATSASRAAVARRSALQPQSRDPGRASEHYIATHPSDMCVALAALDARVLATGNGGERATSRLPISTACRAIRRRSTAICGRTRSSPRSSCRRRALPATTPT